MISEWRWKILGAGLLGLYLLVLGILTVLLSVANRSDKAMHQARVSLIQLAHTAQAGREAADAPWTAHIRKVDDALATKNLRAAVRVWHEAYVAALGSQRWEGMVEVGDVSLRIGKVSGIRKASESKARRLYLAALFRARQQGSVEGVLRTAEAFAALGDREVVDQCLRIAEGLAARVHDAQAHARVRAFSERLTSRSLGAKSFELDEF